MTITPYTTPLQYEYKPLNLIAFAEPLSKMQEQFDIVKASIDESDFDITNLPFGTDPERAKALLKIVEGKRDELAQSLAETKNYKQAASKLKELNTVWQEDPEVTALKGNYDKYVADVQLAKDNVKSSYWNQAYADQWLNRAKREYQGANFTADENNPEGDYQVFGKNPRVKDLQKEFEELAYKIASAVPGESREGALQELGIDYTTWDKQFLQETIEEKNADVVAQRVNAYLKTLPQYKEFFLEKADYDFADLKTNPNLYQNTAKALNDEYISTIDSEIAYIKKAAKKNPSLLTNPDYLDLLTEREAAVNAKTTGEYNENAVRNLYDQKYLADAYDMTALGKVFAYKNVKRNYTWQDVPQPSSGGGGSGGDGTDWTGLGIENWKEAGYETLDLNTLATLKKENSTKLKGITENIGKLAGNAVARITIGTADSSLYAKVKNRQDLIWDNQQKLLKAVTENINAGGNTKGLIARLKEAGLTATEADAKRLMTSFGTKGEAIGDYQTLLEQGRSSRNTMYSAVQGIENMIKTTAEDESILAGDLLNMGNDVFSSSGSYWVDAQGNKNPTNTMYALDDYQKADNIVTYDDLAKKKGYKSLRDAVSKGEYFDAETGGKVRQRVLGTLSWSGPSDKASVMTYQYIGNPKVDKYVANMFSSTNDILNLDPAYTSSWNEVPGFREGDTGLTIDIKGNRKARLVKAGDQVLYEVPIAWVTDGVTQRGVATAVPSAALELPNQKVLKNIDIITNTDDAADIQTNASIKSLRFDRVYQGNTLNDYNVQNTSVTKGGGATTLYPITYDANTNIVVEKVYDANSYGPKLKIALVDANTGEKQYVQEGGKDWYVDASLTGASDAAKVKIMQALGQ